MLLMKQIDQINAQGINTTIKFELYFIKMLIIKHPSKQVHWN